MPIEAYNGKLPQLQLAGNTGSEILWSTYSPPHFSAHRKWAWIEVVIVRNRTMPTSGQAIGGVLIQSIYNDGCELWDLGLYRRENLRAKISEGAQEKKGARR